jgi:hypothetical protein
MDSGNVSAIISAVSGLSGVGIGSFLTYLKDKRAERIKDERDSSYLAILVVSHLERFVNGCWHVALDDGTSEGQPAGRDGLYYMATVKAPEFKPLDIKVEWKVLPRDIMYDILQIPDKQDHIENRLANPGFEEPPDYSEYFWARQRDYAALGLEVSAVAKRLRTHASMPIVESPPGEWNRDIALQEAIDKVAKERADYERRWAESFAKLPPPSPVPTTPT